MRILLGLLRRKRWMDLLATLLRVIGNVAYGVLLQHLRLALGVGLLLGF